MIEKLHMVNEFSCDVPSSELCRIAVQKGMLDPETLVRKPNTSAATCSDLLEWAHWHVHLESDPGTLNRQICGATLWYWERGHNPFL
jgi:hypothetical protein